MYVRPTRTYTPSLPRKAAIPLCASLLCLSSRDFFLRNWGPLTDTILLPRLRDRPRSDILASTGGTLAPVSAFHVSVTALVRLIWVYLFRDGGAAAESGQVAQKRMETLLRGLLPPGGGGGRRVIGTSLPPHDSQPQAVPMLGA